MIEPGALKLLDYFKYFKKYVFFIFKWIIKRKGYP